MQRDVLMALHFNRTTSHREVDYGHVIAIGGTGVAGYGLRQTKLDGL